MSIELSWDEALVLFEWLARTERAAKPMHSSATVHPNRCWPPQRPGAHPGYPRVTRAKIEAALTGEAFAAAGSSVTAMVENARAAAKVLSGDRLQGLSEIVQNVDDAGATRVLFRQTAPTLNAAAGGSGPAGHRQVRAGLRDRSVSVRG
jgi:hypothetical protein